MHAQRLMRCCVGARCVRLARSVCQLVARTAAVSAPRCAPVSRDLTRAVVAGPDHIIGNVTSDPKTGKVTQLEAINDISSVILYKGIYHICEPPEFLCHQDNCVIV